MPSSINFFISIHELGPVVNSDSQSILNPSHMFGFFGWGVHRTVKTPLITRDNITHNKSDTSPWPRE